MASQISPKIPSFSYSVSTFPHKNQLPPFYRNTFSHIFQECAKEAALGPGRKAHARMVICGFSPTTFFANCLFQMHIKCSSLNCAGKVFDRLPDRDRVWWNALLFGHSVSGRIASAQLIFDSMPDRDVISWNSLISGYLQNGDSLKSVEVVVEMGKDGVGYDETTFAVVLKACSGLEDGCLGQASCRLFRQ